MINIIYGGSFNPPTIAHVLTIRYVINKLNPDNFIILPTKTPPHKKSDEISDELRLEMIKCTFKGMGDVIVSDIEYHMEGPSYTYRTLRLLSERYDNLYFMMGMDSFNTFKDWVKPYEILKYAKILVLNRGGIERLDHNIYNENKDRFIFMDNPIFELSSTEVRRMVKDGEDIRYFVLDDTYRFIRNNGIWRKDVR